ncbi:hypothetical protein FXO37_07856 [Capsicum annuum]|nr:hypothetical protein FXO37_07856 [Capsicum annuum]
MWKILWVKPTTQSLFSFLTTPPMPPFPEFPRTDDFLQEVIFPSRPDIPKAKGHDVFPTKMVVEVFPSNFLPNFGPVHYTQQLGVVLPLLLRSFFAFVFCTSFIVRVLCEGIPEQAEIPPVARAPAMNAPASGQAVNASAQKASQPAVPSSGPDANPLDLFPQLWLVIIEIHTVESKSNKNSTDNS